MKRVFVIFSAFVFCFTSYLKAQEHKLYGTITDNGSGENLSGCNVYILNKSTGTISNAYGYYSLSIPKAKVAIVYSFVGYWADTIYFNLHNDSIFNITLNVNNSLLKGIEISTKRGSNKKIGQEIVQVEQIKTMPAVMGEPDVMKSLQLLPGIQTTNEGTTNLSIRGGSHDQNLILLDEAPVYNPSHALSLVSAFNTDALKEVSVYKTYFPSQYGGRLSSVIELKMKEGNNKSIKLSGGIGLIASKLTMELPIIKDKTSLMISGRYGYPGNTLNTLVTLNNSSNTLKMLNNVPKDNIVWFYDINFKIKHRLNNKNVIYISSYVSKDRFELKPLNANSDFNWDNTTITARWNHIINSKMFINSTLYFSKYHYLYFRLDNYNNFNWESSLQEYNYKTDIDYFLNSRNRLKFGSNIGFRGFLPGEISKNESNSNFTELSLHKQNAVVIDAYISDDFIISPRMKLSMGLRYSSLMNIGEDDIFVYNDNIVVDTLHYDCCKPIKYHYGLEPRLAFVYDLNSTSSIIVSYSRTKQYVQLLSNSSVGLPTDVWLPANSYIEPAIADNYSIKYSKSLFKNTLNSSVELYYRNINNIIDFVDNADLFLNEQIEMQVLSGKRVAYGLEFLLQKDVGKLNGWISYTLSKTDQKVEGINNDNWYPAYFDKRHNLSIFTSYKVSKSMKIAFVFKLSSGGNITVPQETYFYEGMTFVKYSDRNAYKLPNYHRLDISFIYNSIKNKQRKFKSEWIFGVYNIYNRKNVFSIRTSYNNGNYDISKIYLYGIVPYISYNFKI